jgi:3-ketosteroid 9alpha-monooxygenase subunit A
MSTSPEAPNVGTNARYPMPAFPKGWYGACDSSELAAGEIKTLRLLGRDLVAVRAEDGDARVYDAHCPHLGAHLGVGGRVEDGKIHCPFHAWQFETSDGVCSGIPYAKRIPQGAALTAWPTLERNGVVHIYFDADGKLPEWEVDVIPELSSAEFVRVATLDWTVKTHAHEVLENVVDTAHLKYVHGSETIPEVEVTHDEPGKFFFELTGAGDQDLSVKLWGLGVAKLDYKIEVPLFEYDTQTPLDAETLQMRTRIYVKDLGSEEANQGMGDAIAKELDLQVQADIKIFENKRHMEQPLLCDGDGPIPIFRRWTEQFYR